MDQDAVKRYILDFNKRPFPPRYPRDYTFPQTQKINVIIGSRRVGKTFLLFQVMNELILQKIPKEKLLYLNLEHPLLFQKIKYDEMHLLLELYWSLFPPSKSNQVIFFIDEPQAMDNWEIAVRSLQDDYQFPIFITGSSSKLLSKEISTILRGRTLTTWVLPLSFKEFLRFKEKEIDPDRLTTQGKAEILYLLNEYLFYGGYPEVVQQNEPAIKLRIMRDLLDLTIFRDIIQRFSVRNITIVQQLIDFLVSNTAKVMSVNKMFNQFKSQGYDINKNVFYEYIDMLSDISFIHIINKFSTNLREINSSAPKFYLNDPGFLSLYSIDAPTTQLELQTFLHLIRKCHINPSYKVYYWKSKENWEVDFLIAEGTKPINAIQVSYSLNNSETKTREFRSLIRCKEEYPDISVQVITYDTDAEENFEGTKISCVPFWKWAL
jgi:hypothetical protein